jgi:GMP synthase-like glutamine amidotransferase
MHVLVFQHSPGEPPEALSAAMAAAGDTSQTVRFFAGDRVPRLDGFDAMLVMGGPMDVWETDTHPWLIDEMAAIRTWVARDVGPYLGICLGHQLLAQAMGGRCARMALPEIAVSDVTLTADGQRDALLGHLPPRFAAMHFHGVEVVDLPPDARSLAATPLCRHQALRVGPRAWGVQFHPELDHGTAARWLDDPANRACALDWLGTAEAVENLTTQSEAHVPGFLTRSATLYAAFRRQTL